jgi:type II secretory pathway component GspD/PulD (secretin)
VSLPRRPLARSWWLVVFALGLTAAPARAQTPRLPTLPLTQLDERGASADLDGHPFTLTFAQAVPIQDLLLLIVRGTNLSLIPDPAIGGSFIGELKNVTIRQALEAILPPLNLEYTVANGFVRVAARQRETRLFDINYVAASRSASATIGTGAGAGAESAVTVSTHVTADVFAEVAAGVQALVSQGGTFNLDRQAGLLQVTDFAERLDRVATYLDAVEGRVQRQVEFDTRIIAVELNDAASPGIDWAVVAAGAPKPAAGSPAPAATRRRGLTGLRITDVTALLTLLAEQGKVETLETARLTTLNNEPAIVRSDALTLSITPQIAADGLVMLSLTPVLKAPAIAEADTLARVASGETLVLSGFTHTREVRERANLGALGGWFGRGTVVTRKRVELVILLTPKVL